jgi:hypothetical protein
VLRLDSAARRPAGNRPAVHGSGFVRIGQDQVIRHRVQNKPLTFPFGSMAFIRSAPSW